MSDQELLPAHPEIEEQDEVMPPPPAMLPATGTGPAPRSVRAGIRDAPEPPSRELKRLGKPPKDALEAAKWAYSMHMQLAYEAMMDDRLTPSQRRAEIRATLAGAKGHLTDAARFDAVRTIEEDRKQIEAKRRGRAAAAKKSGRPPAPAGAKVIPIRGSGEGKV